MLQREPGKILMCLVADGASRTDQGVVRAREQAAETRLVCDATCKVVQQARGCQELKRKQDLNKGNGKT